MTSSAKYHKKIIYKSTSINLVILFYISKNLRGLYSIGYSIVIFGLIVAFFQRSLLCRIWIRIICQLRRYLTIINHSSVFLPVKHHRDVADNNGRYIHYTRSLFLPHSSYVALVTIHIFQQFLYDTNNLYHYVPSIPNHLSTNSIYRYVTWSTTIFYSKILRII